MTRDPSRQVLLWTARVLALAVALFIGAFALDEAGAGWVPFLIHASPTLVLLGALGLSWRWEWIGALANIALATWFAMRLGGHVERIVLISGPLLLTGLLFLWSWTRRRRTGFPAQVPTSPAS